MASRQTLPDRQDELLLAEAEMEVRVWCAIALASDVTMSRLVDSLTAPEIRHHVQTILDLTPTKRG